MIKNAVEAREKIEWINWWIERANDTTYNRILLIGDSVARDYRKVLNARMSERGYVVDLLAMSHSIFDNLYLLGINYYIEVVGAEYRYDYVIFNGGTHHGYSVSCIDQENKQREYCQRLKDILKMLERINDNIITLGGTPENAAFPEAKNSEIEMRNNLLQSVSLECGYKFVDLYKRLWDKDLFMRDRYHYLEAGNEYIADIVQGIVEGWRKEREV